MDRYTGKNILIINTAFLGDIALTSFLIQYLKDNLDCKISVVTTQQGSDILKPVKAIDNMYIFDKRGIHRSFSSAAEFANSISKDIYDYVLSLHKSFRTSYLVKDIKALNKVGYNDASFSYVYNQKIQYKFHKHEVERYLEFLSVFDIETPKVDDIKIDLNFTEDDKNYVENLLVFNNSFQDKKTICLAPGSVWETKKWGKDKYFALARKLSKEFNVVIIGTENDKLNIKDSNIIDLTGKTSFAQTYYLLSKSSLLVTNDSAPTHFAAMVNCPTITIYGPTNPVFGFSPLSKNSTSVYNENLNCHPCRIHGSDSCPIGTHECMESITVDDIYDKASEILHI